MYIYIEHQVIILTLNISLSLTILNFDIEYLTEHYKTGRTSLSISSLPPGPARTLWLPLRPDDNQTTEVLNIALSVVFFISGLDSGTPYQWIYLGPFQAIVGRVSSRYIS